MAPRDAGVPAPEPRFRRGAEGGRQAGQLLVGEGYNHFEILETLGNPLRPARPRGAGADEADVAKREEGGMHERFTAHRGASTGARSWRRRGAGARGWNGASAQSFPVRARSRSSPRSAPGSSPDVCARVLADYLTQLWGQQVIVHQPAGRGRRGRHQGGGARARRTATRSTCRLPPISSRCRSCRRISRSMWCATSCRSAMSATIRW